MPYAEADGAKLYYEVAGHGEPLLMIPGYTATTFAYWANVPVLAEHFRVIVYDPRGAGRSDVPSGPYSMEMLAADACSVLDTVGAHSAHVFGASMGGMTAQNLGLLHPERVRSLALACTTAGGAHHVLPPAESLALFVAASTIADPAAAVRSTYPVNYSTGYAAAHDAEIVARALQTADLRSTPEGRAGQLAAVQGHDTYDRLPQLAIPTLIAHGDADGVVPVENGRILAERIPHARLSIYEGAKHLFFAECADRVNAEMRAFFSASTFSAK